MPENPLGLRQKAAITAGVFVCSAVAALLLAWIWAPRPVVVDKARLRVFEQLRSSVHPPRAATAGELQSTVVLAACTGTKVGPRHYLTAAHCLVEPDSGNVKPWLRPSFPITISRRLDTRVVSPDDLEAQVVIQGVHIHPDYRWDLGAAYREEDYRPDVALIVVDRDVEGIPVTPVGGWRVPDDAELALVGTRPAGMEPADAAPVERRVKWIPARAVDFDPYFEFDRAKLERALLLTVGPPADQTAYSIGFGDSGGPVIQTIAGTQYVVGVHAATFELTNGHARLDDESGFGVASWLRGLGVQVVFRRGASS